MSWGAISYDYPWGVQPDAIEHQMLLLINKVAFIIAFAWLSLMVCIFHTHQKNQSGNDICHMLNVEENKAI